MAKIARPNKRILARMFLAYGYDHLTENYESIAPSWPGAPVWSETVEDVLQSWAQRAIDIAERN